MKSSYLLPNQNYADLIKQINSKYNTTYIESLILYLLSKINNSNICIHFPSFYLSFYGIQKDFSFDITEDYPDIKYQSWFYDNLNNKLIETYDVEDSDDEDTCICCGGESDEEEDKFKLDIDKLDELSKNTDNCKNKLNFVKFREYPVYVNVIQKMEFTLDELIDDLHYPIGEEEWLSILFQIIYSLIVGQKYFSLCHNDLHSSNIMFVKTDQEYIYYTLYGKHYKIKTFNKIVKIIDFGRASFHFNNEWFMSDVFSPMETLMVNILIQNNIPILIKLIKPVNYSFDLIRLATTIYTRLRNQKNKKMLDEWMMDDYGDNVINEEDNFELYLHIARYCHNAVPVTMS